MSFESVLDIIKEYGHHNRWKGAIKMIEVTCPASRFNTHRERYSRRNDASMITLKIDENGVKFEMDLTVAEAESLANDLKEWAKEIKGEEDTDE